MSQYWVRVVTTSPAVADQILKSEEHDTGCTGGVRDLGDGSFAVHAILEDHQMLALRRTLGVVRLEVMSDVEADRQARMQELMGRPAF